MKRLLFASSLAAALVAVTPCAHAQAIGAAPRAYAIVVGSNVGGPGQAPLHFAEDDAKRVAQVLRELGHYDPRNVQTLLHPDVAHVLQAIDDVGAKVRASAARGEQAEVVFYYSGHARASAVNLGSEELALSMLRDRLNTLPSTLTIVMLDACQSGSFSRIKGAEPAADFTYNSVSHLTQKGLAVMASSTAQELSQESDELKGSYFTHHLVTALRGAGDADGDGRVSLDEAYRYAYRRTLASTARTQVGEQHVTLETDLAGQGEVPVTFPSEAKAQLELPSALDARVLIQHRISGAVLAEVQKAPGAPVRLAFIAGAYNAIVGKNSGIVDCRLNLTDDQITQLDLTPCTPVVQDTTVSKGGSPDASQSEIDRYSLELSVGFIGNQTDAFTDRLVQFGYSAGFVDLLSPRYTIGVSRNLVPHLTALLQFGTLSGDSYTRSIGSSTDTASWNTYGAGLYLRASTDLAGRWFGVYGQAGLGVSYGVLTYQTQQTGVPPSSSDAYANYLLGSAVGMTTRFPHLLTLYLQGGYDRAPAIHNLLGDTHDSGGFSVSLGLRVSLGDNQ